MSPLFQACLLQQVDSSSPAATQGADHERTGALAAPNLGLDILDHGPLVRIRLERAQALPVLLRGDGEQPRRGPGEASVEPKRGDAAPRCVRQELEVVERAAAVPEAREHVGPPCLALVAVRELDVRVREGARRCGQLLQTDDGRGHRRVRPCVVLDDRAANPGVCKIGGEGIGYDTYVSYSLSSKMRCGSRSTEIVNPASMSFFAVVGVSAARRSNSFFSQRSQRGCAGMMARIRGTGDG
jgi:hypothetical protein